MDTTEKKTGPITDATIKAWISSGDHFHERSIGPNLSLVFPDNFKKPVYRFRYRMGAGKTREVMKLGKYPDLSLADARRLAKQYLGQIVNGISPKAELAKRKAESARDENLFTVSHLTARFFEQRVIGKIKRPDNKKWVLDRLDDALGKMPVESVTGVHIADMLQADLKRGKPASTNKLLEVTKQVFAFAAAQHLIATSPAQYLDKAHDAGGKHQSRDRNLSRSELEHLFKAMRDSKGFGRQNQLTTKLLLMLCVRKCELTQAKKSEFDLEAGVWHLGFDDRKTKTKQAIKIPLPRQAVDALRELFELSSGDYLLPARKTGSRKLPHISDSTLNQALETHISGIEKFSVHDLRRTAKTKLEEDGVNELVSELCLNHKRKGVSGVYGRHAFFEERKAALQKWANYLESCETGEAWNVVPMKRKA